jgi:uncharacterized protein YbjQ (UPF0145 family)
VNQAQTWLPDAAQRRIEAQRASGVSGSLLTASGAASVRSASLEAVGEVFGCIAMHIGWTGVGCGWYGMGRGAVSPVTTSGRHSYAGLAPYVQAYEGAWYGAVGRLLAEAAALGAHGVVGVVVTRRHLEGGTWEFAALGTAVRSTDPVGTPVPARGHVWCTSLSAEDCASAILSGFMPHEMVMGVSVASKHEDWQMQQQRRVWAGNVEVTGLTDLITAARWESRALVEARASHAGAAELVITAMELDEFDTTCGEEVDLHARSTVVGTVLVPIPRISHRYDPQPVLTVMPMRDAGVRPRP